MHAVAGGCDVIEEAQMAGGGIATEVDRRCAAFGRGDICARERSAVRCSLPAHRGTSLARISSRESTEPPGIAAAQNLTGECAEPSWREADCPREDTTATDEHTASGFAEQPGTTFTTKVFLLSRVVEHRGPA
jgi:hypothetical protein